MMSSYRQFLYLVERNKAARWVLLIVLASIAGLMELTGAFSVYALLAMLSSPGDRFEVPVAGDLRRFFPTIESSTLLMYSLIAIGVFFVLRAGLLLFQSYLQQRVVQNAGLRLSTRLLRGYLEMPYSFH